MYSARNAKVSGVATKDLGERVVRFLRQRHPVKTADNVAAEANLPVSTVAKWIEGASAPGGFAVVMLTCAYGPEFLNAIMLAPPAWLDRAAREEEQRRLKAEIASLQAKLERSA